MRKAVECLRPNKWKVFLFVLLGLVVIGGHIQSWAFAPPEAPKPAGYGVLRFLPLWPIATMMLLPLLALSSPFMDKGIDITSLDTWYSILIVGGYLYLVASLSVAVVENLISKKTAS